MAYARKTDSNFVSPSHIGWLPSRSVAVTNKRRLQAAACFVLGGVLAF